MFSSYLFKIHTNTFIVYVCITFLQSFLLSLIERVERYHQRRRRKKNWKQKRESPMSLSSSILFHILLPLPNVATLTYYYGTKSINHKAHCDWHQKLINCRQIVFGMTVTLSLWKCHFFHERTFEVRKGRKWSWLFSEIVRSKVSWIKNADCTRILPFLWYSDLHKNKSIVFIFRVIYLFYKWTCLDKSVLIKW